MSAALLVIVAIVVAVNPTRLVGVLPRPAGLSPGAVAAAGAGLAAGVFVLIAAVADPLLDAIEVSAATMRAAAGLVLVMAALRDLLVGPPGREPALDGWGAVLVPVAIPMVARPQVGVLALSAGAIEGVLPVAVGAAAVVGLVAGVAGVRDGTVAARILRWGAVVGSVGAGVIGVVYTVEGIYTV